MANMSDIGVKLYKKQFKILTRKTYPKGIKAYITKRDGRSQSHIILATFDIFGVAFDAFRNSETIAFAVSPTEKFEQDVNSRSMREVAEIATHIALVVPDGESILYAIQKGDEFRPFYLDFTYKYYVQQIGDPFVPAENL